MRRCAQDERFQDSDLPQRAILVPGKARRRRRFTSEIRAILASGAPPRDLALLGTAAGAGASSWRGISMPSFVELLRNSVKKRLMRDLPVAVLFSDGVDSKSACF